MMTGPTTSAPVRVTSEQADEVRTEILGTGGTLGGIHTGQDPKGFSVLDQPRASLQNSPMSRELKSGFDWPVLQVGNLDSEVGWLPRSPQKGLEHAIETQTTGPGAQTINMLCVSRSNDLGSEVSDELKGNVQHKRRLQPAPQNRNKGGRFLKRNREFVFLCEIVLFSTLAANQKF